MWLSRQTGGTGSHWHHRQENVQWEARGEGWSSRARRERGSVGMQPISSFKSSAWKGSRGVGLVQGGCCLGRDKLGWACKHSRKTHVQGGGN